MVRRHFKQQVRAVAAGEHPVGVAFDEAEALHSVIAGTYIVGPDTDLATIPLSHTLAALG
jgi:hypothetical protein